MKLPIQLLIFIYLIIISSCTKEDCCAPPLRADTKIVVFKWRADYSNFAFAMLSKDKDSIYYANGNFNSCPDAKYKLTSLINGYYSDGECHYWPNLGYLNITKDDFDKNYQNVSNDSLMSLLLDTDPFLEYYLDENNILKGVNDTAKINQMIRNNELSIKLIKIK